MEIKTPSGYIVEYKEDFTYGEYNALQRQLVGSAEVSQQGIKGVSGSSALDVNLKALEVLIIKVTLPDGKVAENKMGAIMEMPRKDGVFLEDTINAMGKLQGLSKKKGS